MKKRILSMLAAFVLLIAALPALPVAAAEVPDGTENLAYTFEGIDGGQVSTQASGKAKLIVFFKPDCPNCQQTLKGISSSDWIKNGEVDVCAIEIMRVTVDEVKAFRDQYCPEGFIQFAADSTGNGNNAAFAYAGILNLGNRITTPLVAMANADNKLCAITTGYLPASDIESTYLPMLNAGTTPDTPQQPDDPQDPDTPQQPGDPQDPDAPQQPSDPQDPDAPQQPSNPQDPDAPQQPVERPSAAVNNSGKPACSHVAESTLVSDATANADAIVAQKCTKCGSILKYEAVSNSAYAAFLKETANAVLNASQKEEVTVQTKIWTSFNRAVFEALQTRPDVTLTVNYVYGGNPYVLTIPAGTDGNTLLDENGFAGFRYMDQILNTK